jgi:hypothetical protein
MTDAIRVDMRDWNRAFESYVAVRKTARKDIIHEKAVDFAFKAHKALPATDKGRIEAELSRDKLLIKLTVARLKAKGIQLKGLPSVRVRRPKGTGGRRTISGFDKLISQYSKKLLRARKKSSGYHRVAFLLLAKALGKSVSAQVNPRSMLNKTSVHEKHTQHSDVYELNAVARGMNCPSTLVARDVALAAMQANMEAFTAQRLANARKVAGFR